MAVFEKKKLDKVTLDDSIPLKCVIDSAEKREDHMVNRLGTGLISRLGIFQRTGELLPLGIISPYVGENEFPHVGRKPQCLPPCSLKPKNRTLTTVQRSKQINTRSIYACTNNRNGCNKCAFRCKDLEDEHLRWGAPF